MARNLARRVGSGREFKSNIAPIYGAGMELRNLLPGLTAKVTHTRPCVVCGTATSGARQRYCSEHRPAPKKRRAA